VADLGLAANGTREPAFFPEAEHEAG
jgi:hypothetical protein